MHLYRQRGWAALLAVCAALAPAAFGETVDVSVEGSLSDRLISLDVIAIDGVRYIPLRSLIEQSGGAFAILPTRARLDLFGETAWVREGDTRVHAFSPFDLSRPVIRQGDHLLIAVDDLRDFFQKAYRKNAGVIGTGIAMPAPASALEPTVTPPLQEPIAGLESMEPVPGVQAPATKPATGATPAPAETTTTPLPGPSALEGLTQRAPSAPRAYRIVMIDPGHGGYDSGAQSGENISEDDIALAIAAQVKGRLAAGGPLQSLMSRETDTNLPNDRRRAAISAVQPDLVVSIHAGTSLSPSTRGVAVFYSPPITINTGALSSAALTTTVGHEVSDESQRLARAIGMSVAESTGAPLRGIVRAPLRALNDTGVPAVLVEVDCLSQNESAQRLLDPVYQGRVADGIVAGVQAFVAGVDPSTTANAAADAPAAEVN